MAILSFLSSVTFVALTYQDLSQFDPCCSQGLPNCMPACTEFYNIRVPKSFINADKIYCGIYLVDYLINLFISQNRRQFIFSWHSIFDLFVFIPPLLTNYDASNIPLFLTAVSRLLRIHRAVDAIEVGDTDVSKKTGSIIKMLLILIYISSGLYVIIENIGLGYYPVTLYFHQGFYYVSKDYSNFMR